MKDEKSV